MYSSDNEEINFISLRKKLKKKLPIDRFHHSEGVAFTAASLAMRYGENIEKAMIAGILHDCAKAYKANEFLELCKKNDIEPSEAEINNPGLLHAKIGSFMANKKYNIDDKYILDAIKYHTTGRPEMTLLDKIIYVADYIEPGRKVIENLDVIRKKAFIDLDMAIVDICNSTIKYLDKKSICIDDMTLNTLNYYQSLRDK